MITSDFDHQLATSGSVNVFIIVNMLTNLHGLRRLEQVRGASSGIREMSIIDKLVGFPLAEKNKPRILACQRRVEKLSRQHPTWIRKDDKNRIELAALRLVDRKRIGKLQKASSSRSLDQ
jgi:hypothetical protein